MSTTPIAVVFNGKTANITAPASSLTAAALIALVPTSLYGGVPVRLATTTAPSTLIDPATNLISTYITVGTLYTFVLVAVARYSITNTNDTNPLTNQVNIDYVPGISYIANSLPTRATVIADAVTAINVLKTANSLSTIATPNTVGVSNDSAAGWYGLYTTSSNTILQSSWLASGSYLFSPVVHYTMRVPHGPNVVAEYLTNQTAGTLIAASNVPIQSNPFPGLYVNDGSATDSTAKSKLIASGTTVAPLASTCSYIVMIVNSYTITQAAVVAGNVTPIYNTTYPLAAVSSANISTFAVLGSTSVVNTTGATNVTGNLGDDNGSGTNTVTVTAGSITMHSGTNYGSTPSSVTLAAHTEAVALRTYLLKLTPGGTSLPGTNAGSTFTAGIYYGAGATTFSGTITLDAQNNPNAMFIFGAASGTMAFGSTTIALANGAQAGNVWFMAPADVTMSAATLFGNIITSGNITDSGSSSVTGRMISTGATVTLNTSTVVIAAAPGTTTAVAAANAVVTVVDTLEFQTPLYLLTQLSLSSSAYGILDANGNLLNNLIPISPVGSFTVAAIVSFTITFSSTAYTVRGAYTQTLLSLLADPSLAPLYVGIPAGKQLTLYKDNGYTLPVSPVTQLQNVQSATMFTATANALAYNSIVVNYAGSQYQVNLANDATYGDTYTNLRAGAMWNFSNLLDTATTKYCLVDATTLTGTNSTIANAYGPWSTNNTATSTTKIAATDPVKFNLITLTAGELAVTGQTTGTAYFPTDYTVADSITFLAKGAAQGMSVIAGNPPSTVWVLFAGSSDPFLPFLKLSSLAPAYNVSARQDSTMDIDMITDDFGTFTLTNISQKFTANETIQWAQYQFPALANVALTACVAAAAGAVPVFTVLAGTAIYPSPAAVPTHNKLYIKDSVEVVMIPPSSIVRPNIDTVLPSSFTEYDLLNYAMTNFGFTSLTAYGMYPTADANQGVLGPLDTVASIINEFNITGKATFQLVPASYAQVTIVYNGTNTILQSMPVICSIAEVILAANVSLGITSPTVLELVSTTIQPSDSILKYATAPTTTGGLYTLTLNLQTQVKENVVVYNSNGYVEYNKKQSMNMTVDQLIASYSASLKLPAAAQVTFTSVSTSAVAASTSTIGTYSRAISGAKDIANLDPNDPTPVTKVSEFTSSVVVQMMSVSVQDLFNINSMVTVKVPKFSNASAVANAAVLQIAKYSATPTATFGLAIAGTGVALAATAIVDSATTYELVETTSPLQWASVTVAYTDQQVAPVTSLLQTSTVLSKIPGFNSQTDVLSLSNGGAALTPYTQTVASIMPATGIVQLYDSAQANVNVTVNLNGTVKIVSVSPRSKLSDVLTALSVPSTQAVVITVVSTKQTAQTSDPLVMYTAPYSFTIVNAPTLYTVTLVYGAQTTSMKYAQGTTVSKMLADAAVAFSLAAGQTFNLSITGQSAALVPTSAPDLTVNTSFTVTASALNSTVLVVGGGVAAVAVLLALFA